MCERFNVFSFLFTAAHILLKGSLRKSWGLAPRKTANAFIIFLWAFQKCANE